MVKVWDGADYHEFPALHRDTPSGGVRIGTLDLGALVLHAEDPTASIKAALRRGFTFIHLSEVAAAIEYGRSLPAKPLLLTYDDGRAELYSVAHPVIESYGIKCNAFLTSDFVSGLSVDASLTPYAPGMTWEQAETMHATGLWEWGNHSKDHTLLSTQTLQQQTDDLGACNEAILTELGVDAQACAYPNGGYDVNTFQALRATGIALGFDYTAGGKSGSLRCSNLHGAHPFALNRGDAATALDYFLDTTLVHWGWHLTGERNAANALGFWVLPSGASLAQGGETVLVDSRAVGTAQTAYTQDYFRVRPSDLLYVRAYTRSELQSAGVGKIRFAQYDEDKAFISYVDVSTFTEATAYIRVEAEFPLDTDCRFVRFEVHADADFNGLVHCKNLEVRRA